MSGCCSKKTCRNWRGSVTERTLRESVAIEDRLDERDVGWLVVDDEHLGSTKQSLLEIQSAAPPSDLAAAEATCGLGAHFHNGRYRHGLRHATDRHGGAQLLRWRIVSAGTGHPTWSVATSALSCPAGQSAR